MILFWATYSNRSQDYWVFDNKIRVLSFFVKIFGRETRNPIKIRNNKLMKLRRER